MLLTNILLGVLGIFGVTFGAVFGSDIKKNKDKFEEDSSWVKSGFAGLTANFFDVFGIGSFAPLTAMLRGFKQVEYKMLPGTLNIGCTIPVIVQAFAFITVVEVEFLTLAAMIAAAVVGSVIGAGIISKMSEKRIQLIMGVALLTTAFLMFSGQLGWISSLGTGTALGLTGWRLIVAIVGNFILGALMTAGIGLYAPCMALVYMLGLSPDVAFPIMMGSCAFLMPAASVKFIREGRYNKKASLAVNICGLAGALTAIFVFTSLPMNVLTWIVIGVVTYTGISLLRDYSKVSSVVSENVT